MKKLSFFLILSLTFLNTVQLIAQGQYQATPLNSNAVANQIYNDYSGDINISVAQIEAHLLNLTQSSTYDPGEDNTTLQVTGMDATSMNVDWDAVPGNTAYRVAYKNLSDATNELNQTAGTAWTWNDPADDALILMSITTFKTNPNGVTSSFADIIIIERLVYFVVGDGANICDCNNNSQVVYDFQSNGVNNVTVDGNLTRNVQYSMTIDFKGNIPTSYMKFKLKYNGEGLYVEMQCLGNLCYSNLWEIFNVLDGCDANSGLSVYFNPNSGNWEISHFEPVIKSVTIKKCQSIVENPSDDPSFRFIDLEETALFPNPANDFLKLNIATKYFQSNERVAIEIFDQIGRTTLLLDDALIENQINISALPAGHYFLRIKNSTNQEIHQFIKME